MAHDGSPADTGSTQPGLQYLRGLGNELESEALPHALPIGQNSPQKCPYGLVSELVSGTTFTAPRAQNLRSYVFRIRPPVFDGRYERIDNGLFLTPPFDMPADPNYYIWGPLAEPTRQQDILESMATIAAGGSPLSQTGMAMHAYAANSSMTDRVFANGDGEMLFVLRLGRLRFVTEFGVIEAAPRELVVIPKGIKFRVEILDAFASGFVCENYGAPFRLPELGLLGGHGLANVVDFQVPVASYVDSDGPIEVVTKYGGNLWSMQQHQPMDVVAWRGTLYPYKYNVDRFVHVGSLTVDHTDPSIYTVLTSPSDNVQGPNADFMIVRSPKWEVQQHTFRPPGFHRNTVGEFVLLIEGMFNNIPAGSFVANNSWAPHGPDIDEMVLGRTAPEDPFRLENFYIAIVESRFPMMISPFARSAKEMISDYTKNWAGYEKTFTPTQRIA